MIVLIITNFRQICMKISTLHSKLYIKTRSHNIVFFVIGCRFYSIIFSVGMYTKNILNVAAVYSTQTE